MKDLLGEKPRVRASFLKVGDDLVSYAINEERRVARVDSDYTPEVLAAIYRDPRLNRMVLASDHGLLVDYNPKEAYGK